MALTDTQKAKVRRYLGYSDVHRGFEPGQSLESTFDSLSTEGEALVVEILGSLDTIQTTLTSSWGRQKVLKAEDVTLTADGEIRALRMEGWRLSCELGTVLNIQPARNPFQGGSAGGVARRG